MTKRFLAAALVPLLAACAATPRTGGPAGTVPPPVSRPDVIPPTDPGRPTTAMPGAFRPPRVMQVPGLEGVIGQTASALQSQFGAARLNVVEGDVRKLQFSGEACVLDVYLYPLTQGATPTATYVDARRSSDGLDVDRVACVTALRR